MKNDFYFQNFFIKQDKITDIQSDLNPKPQNSFETPQYNHKIYFTLLWIWVAKVFSEARINYIFNGRRTRSPVPIGCYINYAFSLVAAVLVGITNKTYL